MRLMVRWKDMITCVVGYGPGDNGSPRAIVINGTGLTAVDLSELELLDIPHKAMKQMRKLGKRSTPETPE